jgi:hypothetical protein
MRTILPSCIRYNRRDLNFMICTEKNDEVVIIRLDIKDGRIVTISNSIASHLHAGINRDIGLDLVEHRRVKIIGIDGEGII